MSEKTIRSPWEEVNIPQPGVMTATEAYRAITDAFEALRLAGKPATNETALHAIANSIGCEPENLKLGGPVNIAKGNKPTLLLAGRQNLPAHILNRIPSEALVVGNELYARISNPNNEVTTEATVKWRSGFQGTTPDHLIISDQLAKDLGLDPQDPGEIVIETMYQKADNLNLDEL